MVKDLTSRVKILLEKTMVTLLGAHVKVLNSPQLVSVMKHTNPSYILTPG
jgi:hypothetical protein